MDGRRRGTHGWTLKQSGVPHLTKVTPVRVRVLSVDLERNRIALSMKKEKGQDGGSGQRRPSRPKPQPSAPRIPQSTETTTHAAPAHKLRHIPSCVSRLHSTNPLP